MTRSARARYDERVGVFSDIQRHLPRLRRAARGTVLELGVRTGNSTAAILAGVEQHGGEVWSVDVDPRCAEIFADHPKWHFVCADSRDAAQVHAAGLPGKIDLLFIDTLHEYEQLREELATWAPLVRPGGRVLLHDAETARGVWRGIVEYSSENRLPYRLIHGSMGLAVIYPGGGAALRLLLALWRPVSSIGGAARRLVSRIGVARRAATYIRGHE